MWTLFVEGGIAMVPVLVVGALSGVAGVARAAGVTRAGAAAAAFRTATGWLVLAGVAMDLRFVGSAVVGAVEDGTDASALALAGGAEALAPAVLGGALAALSALFCAVGDLRDLREPRSA